MRGWVRTPWFTLRTPSGRVELSAQLVDGGLAPDGAGRLEVPTFHLRLDDRLALGFAPGEGSVRMTRESFPSTRWRLAPAAEVTADDALEFERLEALARELVSGLVVLQARAPTASWAQLGARGDVQVACATLLETAHVP